MHESEIKLSFYLPTHELEIEKPNFSLDFQVVFLLTKLKLITLIYLKKTLMEKKSITLVIYHGDGYHEKLLSV